MDTRIHLEKAGGRLILHAPEHPDLARRAKELGGRRSGDLWSFAEKNEAAVRKIAQGLFGSDGGDGGAKVTLRMDLSLYGEGSIGNAGEAWLAGRLVARRPSFDQRVELGPGVKLVRGGFGVWGGSRQQPALDARYGTVVDIEGVRKSAAEFAAERHPIMVAIVDGKKGAVVGAWSRTVTTKTSSPRAGASQAPVTKPAGVAPKEKASRALAEAKKAAKGAKAAVTAKAKTMAAKAAPALAKARKTAKKARTAATAKAEVVRAKAVPALAKARKTATKARAAATAKAKVVKAKAAPALARARKTAKKARAVATAKAGAVGKTVAKAAGKAVRKARAQAGALSRAARKTLSKAKARLKAKAKPAKRAPARKAGKKRGR